VLYIDEVNLLDDYIADSLLDAAAMGWNTIEREGISFRHPSRFILVGSMNPEEGELRPQILDRFGLCVEVSASMDPEERIEIAKRVEEFHRDPIGFYNEYEDEERRLTKKIVKARELLPKVEVGEDLLKLLAETVINLGIKTNRAEITTIKTAKAIAALNGRRKVSLEDLEKAMEMSLPHRLRDRPFQKPPQMRPPKPREPEEKGRKEQGRKRERKGNNKKDRKQEKNEGNGRGFELNHPGNLERNFKPQETNVPNVTSKKERSLERETSVYQRSKDVGITVVNFPKGIPVSYTVPIDDAVDVDLYNSVVWAILNGKKPPLKLDQEDIRVRIRKTKAPTLWVLLIDSSGSMAVKRRISIAKGIARKLVENGYVKKSKMALIVARGNQASVVIPPTKNYLKVIEEIDEVPTGGRTPLSSALHNLLLLAERERMKNRFLRVRAFLITDGKANVPLWGKRVKEEIVSLAKLLKKKDVELTVYDTTTRGINPGLSYVPLLESIAGARIHRIQEF